MLQLLILSGKGGTGKTTIAGAFIKYLTAQAYADCDVDAPNLHLINKHFNPPQTEDYYGLPKAVIEYDKCIDCGKCMDFCRFDSIYQHKDKYIINEFACEGCGVCEFICPTRAIKMVDSVAGTMQLYTNGDSFSTAQLKMGSGTSGKLVAAVKKRLMDAASNIPLAIIDGSPGIGCPVIASLSGADIALIVAEPSLSGISDMERIIKTAEHFETKVIVCVNKYDTNISKTKEIEAFCQKNNLLYAGRIPYDLKAVLAINEGKSIIDIDCASGNAVRNIIRYVTDYIKNQYKHGKGEKHEQRMRP